MVVSRAITQRIKDESEELYGAREEKSVQKGWAHVRRLQEQPAIVPNGQNQNTEDTKNNDNDSFGLQTIELE